MGIIITLLIQFYYDVDEIHTYMMYMMMKVVDENENVDNVFMMLMRYIMRMFMKKHDENVGEFYHDDDEIHDVMMFILM